MQDFFDNAEPRTVAIMLFAIVFLVSAVEVTYLLWPQVVSYKNLHSSHESWNIDGADRPSTSAYQARPD